ncbi:Ectonucleotide pyrophosphatase/phosphodiesterase family member 2 [Armadillidium vulgare]|nr:Ectonucleotide pyrophosphatase/phosphodiesterase family member 2 [Armadillidium vulgare]
MAELRKSLSECFGGVLSVLAFILLVTLTIRYSSPRSEEIELPDSLDSSSCPKDFDPLPLIVFSLDGFHPKYLTKNVTPTLNKMIEKGVTTPFMTPSFPSLTFPNHYTIVTVLEWLSLPKEKRPSYISVYSHQPDKAGHGYGPDSEQVLLELKKVDSMVKQLVKALIKKDLLSCVNIIVVSDHGMSATGEDKVIHLEKLISKDLVNQILVGPGAFGSISLKNQSRSITERTEENSEKLLTESTPWGAPVPKNSSTDVQVLLHLDFVSGYSSYLKQTVWTSFVIKTLPSSPSEEKWQWVADPRLVEEDSQSCSSVIYDEQGHNYTLYPNFPPGNAQNESTKVLSTLVSNSVPLHPHLYSHWKELINTFIPKWFKESQSPLNVIVGPVFDENNDGLADEVIPIEGKRSIPTDYFFIVSKCSSGKNATDYALLFGAKVQDIERITNLEFFSKLSHKRRLEILTNEYYHLW